MRNERKPKIQLENTKKEILENYEKVLKIKAICIKFIKFIQANVQLKHYSIAVLKSSYRI